MELVKFDILSQWAQSKLSSFVGFSERAPSCLGLADVVQRAHYNRLLLTMVATPVECDPISKSVRSTNFADGKARRVLLDFKGVKFSKGIELLCDNCRVVFFVENPNREVLRGVNGRFKPERLTAVLGPTGAGKTTLLRILSGNRKLGVQGCIQVNGRRRGPTSLRSQSAFIGQEFNLLEALTVRETLKVAADLKLSRTLSNQERDLIVNDIANLLDLQRHINTQVKNLSEGEKRRLPIGIELVSNPPIMFLDEPTRNLDTMESARLVSILRVLALTGRTIVVALHQPCTRVFHLFDDVLVMSIGRSIYCGPLAEMHAVFQSAGFDCPRFYNRADFALEIASSESEENLRHLEEQIGRVLDEEAGERQEGNFSHFQKTDSMVSGANSTTSSRLRDQPTTLQIEQEATSTPKDAFEKSTSNKGASSSASFCRQFIVLLRRSFLITWRNSHLTWIRSTAHIAIAFMLGIIYYNIGNDAYRIYGNVSCIFLFTTFIFFLSALPIVLTYPQEAGVFFREHSYEWYTLKAYYLSKFLSDLPFQVLNPSLFLIVAHWLTDQPTDNYRPLMLWLICVLTSLLGHSYGLVIGTAFDRKLGAFILPVSTIPFILFSGYFLRLTDIPYLLKWISYLSSFRYGFEGAIICIYGMNRGTLDCSGSYCHWKTPWKFLEEIRMLNACYTLDITALLIWTVCLHILFLIIFKYQVQLSKR